MKNKDREKINELLTYLKKSNDYRDRYEIIDYIKNNDKLPFDDDTFYDVVKIMIDNNIKFDNNIEKISNLYRIIVSDRDDKTQYDLFLKLIKNYMNNYYDNYSYESYFKIMYYLFDNKKYILYLNDEIKCLLDNDDIKYFIDYMRNSRNYYVDEIAYFSAVIKTLEKYKNNRNNEVLEEQLKEDKKIAGLYNIDESKFDNLPNKIDDLENRYDQLLKKSSKIENYFIDYKGKLQDIFAEFYEPKLKEILDNKKESKELLNQMKEFVNEIKNIITNSNIDSSLENRIINLLNEKFDQLIDNKSEISNNQNIINDDNNSVNYYHAKKILDKVKHKVREIISSKPLFKRMDCYDDSKDDIYLKMLIESTNLNDKIKGSNLRYLINYYIALYNDTLDRFKIIANFNIARDNFIVLLSREISEKVDINLFTYLVYNRLSNFLEFIWNDKVDLYLDILNINPEFDLKYDFDKIDKAIELLGIDLISSNNPIIDNNIDKFYDLDKYVEIYKINPDFNVSKSIFNNPNLYKIYSIEEIATELNDTRKQELLNNFFCDNANYCIQNPELIKKLVNIISADKDIDESGILDLFRINKITLEQYIKMTTEQKNSIYMIFWNINHDYDKQSSKKKLKEIRRDIKRVEQ